MESALLTWGESHLTLDGNLEFSEEDFLFDVNLTADGIDWDRVEQILEEEDQESDPEAQGILWSPVLEGILDGKTVDMASQGEIDLIDQKIDLTVVVAPQKTVDRVVKRIPGVRYILGGTLISYPVRVRGDITAPKVSALSPSAVGSELLGIMERTFRLPVRIIQPLLPGKRKGQGAFQK